jgi:hypothetical protein
MLSLLLSAAGYQEKRPKTVVLSRHDRAVKITMEIFVEFYDNFADPNQSIPPLPEIVGTRA